MSYLRQYESNLKFRQYSKYTIIHYLSDLKIFQKFAGKQRRQVNKSDVARFVKHQDKQKLKPKTINRRLWVIKEFYDYLIEELDYQLTQPVRKSHFIRVGRPIPKSLTDIEVIQLYQIITDLRDRAMFCLMLRCGLRVGELANLEVKNIDLFGRQLRFTGKGKKERVVSFSIEIRNQLIQCLSIRPKKNPKLFWSKKNPLKPVKQNSIQRLFKRYGNKLNIKIHCHMLRHTFARQMTEKGVDRTVLRDLMGHTSITSTDVYGKLSDPFIKESYFAEMKQIVMKNNKTNEGVMTINS